mmetsp:Transcript_16237/g.41440  ORF Transcript_16237/g.41440 Transcript_16237/m.41440 type:complete len:226 (+) Transcript_16237:3902-4579(+)
MMFLYWALVQESWRMGSEADIVILPVESSTVALPAPAPVTANPGNAAPPPTVESSFRVAVIVKSSSPKSAEVTIVTPLVYRSSTVIPAMGVVKSNWTVGVSAPCAFRDKAPSAKIPVATSARQAVSSLQHVAWAGQVSPQLVSAQVFTTKGSSLTVTTNPEANTGSNSSRIVCLFCAINPPSWNTPSAGVATLVPSSMAVGVWVTTRFAKFGSSAGSATTAVTTA